MANSAVRLTLDTASIEALAAEIGVNILTKQVVRFPAEYRGMVETFVCEHGLTGSLTQHFSQGGVGFVSWEYTR